MITFVDVDTKLKFMKSLMLNQVEVWLYRARLKDHF